MSVRTEGSKTTPVEICAHFLNQEMTNGPHLNFHLYCTEYANMSLHLFKMSIPKGLNLFQKYFFYLFIYF